MTFGLYLNEKDPSSSTLRIQGGINIGKGMQLNVGQTIQKDETIRSAWWRAHDYRIAHLRKRYGIPIETAAKIVEQREGGTCEICGEKVTQLCVDHDHQTGQLRGLICYRCNNLLIGIESKLARKLWDYLARYGGKK